MILSAVLPVILPFLLAHGYNYCNNRTHRCILENNVHFMCKLDKIPSLGGTRYHAVVPDTPKLRSEILRIINHFRNQFAGGGFRTSQNRTFATASRMRQVMWDSELAYMARAHASTVSFKHTLCRSTLRFPEVGECLSMMVPKHKHTVREALHKLFKLMFDEHLNIMDPDALLEAFHPIREYICAHFTILISDRVSRVGCGVAVGTNCRQGSTSNFCHFLTCHFDFDNVNGSYVYKAGKPVSSCGDWGTGRSKEFAHLCSNDGSLIRPRGIGVCILIYHLYWAIWVTNAKHS
ncbi:venom allergen 3-like isoform X3 [Drosophila teissieri]|nr:venom allergen 3-like isoform X3 [Drosophila teissieri]